MERPNNAGMLEQADMAGAPAVLAEDPKMQELDAAATEDMKGTEAATPEEQAAYEEAMTELGTVLYNDEGTSQALMNMVQPEDPVGTASKTVIQLISQMDEKINLDDSTVYSVTEEAVERLIELVEGQGQIKFSDKQAQQVLMTSWEGIMAVFGADSDSDMREEYNMLAGSLSDNDIRKYQKQYQELLKA